MRFLALQAIFPTAEPVAQVAMAALLVMTSMAVKEATVAMVAMEERLMLR
jgi:hypothetical protein